MEQLMKIPEVVGEMGMEGRKREGNMQKVAQRIKTLLTDRSNKDKYFWTNYARIHTLIQLPKGTGQEVSLK